MTTKSIFIPGRSIKVKTKNGEMVEGEVYSYNDIKKIVILKKPSFEMTTVVRQRMDVC